MAISLPRKPPIVCVPVARALWRVHRSDLDAIWCGPGAKAAGRFDDPALRCGVLYAGSTPGVAVLETLVRGAARCVVGRSEWKARSIARLTLRAPLRMLQFEGKRLPEFGIGAERAYAGVYDECQELSALVHATLPDVDGIQFRSRWDQSKLCWALFDRAAHRVAGAAPSIPLDGSPLGDDVLDAYPIRIV